MSGTPHTPIGGPRLVSKLCVVGEATEEEGNGASFLLFCKLNVPHSSITQSYPLFPDDHIQLRSTTLAPLTPSGSLALSPPSSPLILEASKRLRIPTSSSISSSSSTARPPEVIITIQDFAVSLVVEGSGGEPGGGSGSYGRASPQRMGSSGSGRRSSFSPVMGGDQESTVFICVLEVAIPCSTVPPLDCYSISLPLPRCLSNTLRFHLSPSSPASSEGYYNIATTPRLLSSPEVPTEELALEGTFQSTPTLEIRWAKGTETSLLDASTSSSGGGRSKMVTVRESSSKLSYTVVDPSSEAGTATEVLLDYQSSNSVHFAGVESSVILDLQLDLPSSQPFEWIELPFVTTNVGLVSFGLLDSAPQQDDPDASTTSTIHSPPSPSPPNRSPSYLSNTSKPNPASTSQLSLLRQQLPSMNETSDLSFAFDQSSSPSPGTSPSIRHRSPLSRNNTASTPDHRTSRRIRLHLDISKIHQHRAHEPFTITLQGSLRLGQQQQQPGEVVLPFVSISGEESLTTCLVTVNSSAVPHAQILGPQSSEPVLDSSSSSSRSKPPPAGERWAHILPPSSDSQASIDEHSNHFKLVLPPPPPPPAPLPPSPNFRTIKARRQSTTSSLHPAQNLFSGSAAGDIQSKGWDQERVGGGSQPEGDAVVETIPKVEVEVVLVPRRPSSTSSELVDASKKGKGKSKASSATPTEWDQLTKMRLLLPPRVPLPVQFDLEEEEEEDTFEFGIIATGSTSPPTLRVLSASIDSRSVAFEIQERDNGGEAEEAPGVVGYVRLFGEEGMRERGGEVEVCFVLEGGEGAGGAVVEMSSKLWKTKSKGREVVLGLPSFGAVVGWQEMKVSVGGEFSLSPLISSSTTISTSTTSSFTTLTHSLPALHAPHQRVLLLLPASPPPTISSRASFFSPSNLPLIILSFLLLSMGTEVRTLRSGLVDMVLSIQTEAFATREAIGRCDAAVQAFNSRPLVHHHPPNNPPSPSFTTSIDSEGNTILLPSFTDVPSSHQHQQQHQQQQRPSHSHQGGGRTELGRPALSYTIGTTLNDLLERNVLGRGVKRMGGGIWRILSYLVAV
ncbi:hypothetical protein BDY24DRAFT_13246 [Mrakia frigida]|uniref:uncharacterized protein n=1 Tax=Mrakia frigida TaxID=29902 RepID=UPI003FCC1E16